MSYGDLGLSLPGSEGWNILSTAIDQYDRAKKNMALATIQQAENYSLMLKAPTSTVGAYLKAGYWLSVASRILNGQPKLLALAFTDIQSGSFASGIPGTGSLTRRIPEIFSDTVYALKPYQSNPQIKAILALLGHQVQEGVQVQTEAKKDQEVVSNTGKAILQETDSALPTVAKWIRPVTWLVGISLVGIGIWYGRLWLINKLPPKIEIVQS